jgi:class 3 adenylate cyclase/predicted ATPase
MRCANCGTDNAAGTKFCSECGTPLASERPQTLAERRRLTVVFVDVVGSTALSNSLDPEDLSELMRGYYAVCDDVVARWEGHVAQYLGDGVMAYFGYPTAHEDDALRAVRAGLDIIDRVEASGGRFQVRVGLHTGLVVVGETLGAGQSEPLALGETPNLASRVQAEAQPGSVVITDATRRLVAGHFTLEDMGERSLKGIAQPTRLYRVAGRSGATRFDAIAESGLAPFVGRNDEVEAIEAAWDAALTGSGQTLVLRGEPGIGKSRLLGVARDAARRTGHDVFEAECSPHNVNSSLFPVIEMLLRRLSFDGRPDGEKLDLLEEFARSRGLTEESVPLLSSLLGLASPPDLPPAYLRERTLQILADLFVGPAAPSPSLLSIEDLHWADPSTVDLVTALAARQSSAPLLTICTTRPEWRPDSHFREIAVEALPETDTRALIAGVAGEKPLPDELAEQITARTGGVPLFVEAVTRTVVEAGVLDEREDRYELKGPLPAGLIPEKVHDSLMARIDRLGPAKPIAQLAATIGRQFDFDLLQIVSGQTTEGLEGLLGRLVELDLVSESGTPPAASYVFKHALIQDAAYESLLRRTREELHGKIASALLEHFPDVAEQRPELIAQHFTAAGEPAQAIPYWLRAGQSAIPRGANHEAIAYLRHGLEQLAGLPDTPERSEQELEFLVALIPGLNATQGWASPDLDRTYQRAGELLAVVKNSPHTFALLTGTFAFHLVAGRITKALALARQVLELATVIQDPTALMVGHWDCCVAYSYAGNPQEAVEHGEACLALYDPEREQAVIRLINTAVRPIVNCYLSEALWMLGHVDQARAAGERAVTVARELGHMPSLIFALGYQTAFRHLLRDKDGILEAAEEAIAIGRAERFTFWEPLIDVYLGWATGGEKGIALTQNGLSLYRAAGNGITQEHMLAALADGLWVAGHRDEAFASLAEARSLAAATGEEFYEPELHRLQGEFGRKTGAADAEASIREAIAIAQRQGARSLELRAVMSLCRLQRDRGDPTDRALLADVYAGFTEGLDTPDLRDAAALLEELGAS